MAGICYFHERDVIYHASGEDESCLLVRFKRAEYQHTVLLKLKGEKLHQGFYTELAEHSHGVGTLDVAEGGAHVHGVGTLAVEDSESHTHGVGTYAVESESNHTHGYGTIAVVAAAAHSHTKGTLAVGDAGAHSHGYGTIAVVAAGNHGHAIGTLAVSVGGSHGHAIGTLAVVAGGAHGHADTFDIDSVGNHNHGVGSLAGSQVNHAHTVSGNTANANLSHTHSSGGYGTDEKPSHEHGGVTEGSGFTGLAGVHTHDITGDSGPWGIANLHQHSISFNTGNAGDDAVTISGYVADGGGHDHGLSGSVTAAANHGHALSGIVADAANHGHNLTGTVADGGGHGHTLSGSTAQEADHDHALTGSVADGGGHGHTLTGSTAADGGHDHSLSGASASGGVHSHSLSGSTVSAGNHDHSISGDTADYGTTPKTYSDQLKIYINGVDKTTEVLALTDLTEFGDGTADHDLVVSGSGEMDISALVTDIQTHEIKVTEPISGKGGRVLCHIECLFEMGEQGPQGTGGEQGPQGPQGYMGVQGPGGVLGTQGPQGSEGHQGYQGYQGFVGVQGPVGGAQGEQGAQGETGVQGPQGDQGDEGAQGAQGYQGEQGAQGEAADHNALTGLQGGQADEYYHLKAVEHPYISGVNAQSLLTTASPIFATVKLSDLTDRYIPYHVSDALGLANSPILTDGTRVSIGTALAADAMLKVYKDAAAPWRVDMENPHADGRAGFIARAENAQVLFDVYSSGAVGAIAGLNYANLAAFRAITTSGLLLYTSTSAPIVLATNSIAAIHIDATQKVGIQRAVPLAALHVNSIVDGQQLLLERDNGARDDISGLRFKVATSDVDVYAKAGIFFQRTLAGDTWAEGDLHFCVDTVEDGENVEITDSVMVLQRGGYVGIGGTPLSLLHVIGGDVTVQSAAAASRIYMKDSAGNIEGYIYADTGTIGFLDADGSWGVRVRTNIATDLFVDGARGLTLGADLHLDIYDWDDAVLREISFGADDSGGAGFKVLRVPN